MKLNNFYLKLFRVALVNYFTLEYYLTNGEIITKEILNQTIKEFHDKCVEKSKKITAEKVSNIVFVKWIMELFLKSKTDERNFYIIGGISQDKKEKLVKLFTKISKINLNVREVHLPTNFTTAINIRDQNDNDFKISFRIINISTIRFYK